MIGFPSDFLLAQHLSSCHEVSDQQSSNQPSFPRVKMRSLEDALRDAIKCDSVSTAAALATQLSAMPDRVTDFLYLAAKKKNESLALVLINKLNSKADIENGVGPHCKYVVAYEAINHGHEGLIKIILQLPFDIGILSSHYFAITSWFVQRERASGRSQDYF